MATPARETSRRTPRRSSIGPNSGTPRAPTNPTTPGQTTITLPRSAARASARRTPRGPGANAAPATPHALRALQRRAAAATPGRDRRKSGRVQRETPMDILRNLAKVLAPTSKPIISSPAEEQPTPPRDEFDDLDNEPMPPRPRLSLSAAEMAGDDDEGSPELQPPILSLMPFDEEDLTQRSIELPRRERSAQDQATLSRLSLASARYSDRFGDLSRIEGSYEEEDFTTMPQEEDDYDNEPLDMTEQPVFDAGGETEDLRRFNLDFSFPTPDVTGTIAAEHAVHNDEEDFMLDAIPTVDAPSPSSDGVEGGTGFEIAMEGDIPQPARVSSSPAPAPVEKTAKQQKLSRHGIPVPRLPSGVVKKLASRFARAGNGGKNRISKETLAAIEQATDWFFEQASEDLSTYSKHAGRKTIDETDVMALMRRQRQVGKNMSAFALAQKHLPKELLQDIRLSKR
ncbi:hypothetical protein AJ80_01655 [Polytolypa hystricis UAMH7299]|uniref:CENP-T/Histone H4 histone fold domain-containing protein n=1 Tax=Polytolypa hystricis (strain UAMH7299) TaxID=1447883 RepID=A0A2B7Z0E4_POLH7|nr:hypothetical protein AJ80_01655 [Polytolypa hystricis UAMH7299]